MPAWCMGISRSAERRKTTDHDGSRDGDHHRRRKSRLTKGSSRTITSASPVTAPEPLRRCKQEDSIHPAFTTQASVPNGRVPARPTPDRMPFKIGDLSEGRSLREDHSMAQSKSQSNRKYDACRVDDGSTRRNLLDQDANNDAKSRRQSVVAGNRRSYSPLPTSNKNRHRSSKDRSRGQTSATYIKHGRQRRSHHERSARSQSYSPPPMSKVPLWKAFLPIALIAIVKLIEPDGGWTQYRDKKSRLREDERRTGRNRRSDQSHNSAERRRHDPSPYPIRRHRYKSPRPERRRQRSGQHEHGKKSSGPPIMEVAEMSGGRGEDSPESEIDKMAHSLNQSRK